RSLLGRQRQPAMRTTVQMQHLAEASTPFTALPMAPADPALPDQPCALKDLLHERIRQGHAVLPGHCVVEVTNVEPRIPLPIERQDPVHLRNGRATRSRRAS